MAVAIAGDVAAFARGRGKSNGRLKVATGRVVPGTVQLASREIFEVPLDKIHRHPHNRPVQPETCGELAESLHRRGVLVPVRLRMPGEHWGLPEGHWQLIDGERRYHAACLAGLETIPAEIVDVTDEQAEAEIAVTNGQREPLNDIERAERLTWLQRPVAEGGAGMTQTEAAAEMGISQPTASLLLSVARLPDPWRSAIIAGEIPGSHLRPVAKYADCPEVLALLWADYEASTKGDDFNLQNWASRSAIEQTVSEVIQHGTRPLTPGDRFDRRDFWRPDFDAHRLDTKAEQKLQIVAIPNDDGTQVRRCINVELWDRLQDDQRRHGSKESPATVKTKAAKPALSPAEQARKEHDQDKELLDRIQRPQGLRELALRFAMSWEIRELIGANRTGGVELDLVYHTLICGTRDSVGSSFLKIADWDVFAQRIVRQQDTAQKAPEVKIVDYDRAKSYGMYAAETLRDHDDGVSAAERIRAWVSALLLWPQCDLLAHPGRVWPANTLPEVWPAIDGQVLLGLAGDLGATIQTTWSLSRVEGNQLATKQARLWLYQFLGAHNTTRQMADLCEELGVRVDRKGKRSDLVDGLIAEHVARNLPCPVSLAFEGKAKAKAGKRQGKGK